MIGPRQDDDCILEHSSASEKALVFLFQVPRTVDLQFVEKTDLSREIGETIFLHADDHRFS